MAVSAGTRLGPYEVSAPLGAGGMGEVYRARDTRLGRDVALKVLPADVAGDADRRARFEREARAVAALSHPNILALFDIGLDADTLFVVTELLDGETLADRLRQGALPVRKAVEIAVAIARGLGAAHEKGIAHRDLKPANVFLLADGQVKILDFGLAREMTAASGAAETQAALTDPGTVLGTAGYMAPEQIRGQQVDGRADLFALGVVLYEMLTGSRAFARETTAETLTAILREDLPDLTTTRADLPPALDRIVRHALEKNPAERFQSARDVIFALEALGASGATSGARAAVAAASQGSIWRSARLAWAVAALALAVAAGLAFVPDDTESLAAPAVRFEVPWPTRAEGATTSRSKFLEVSPDGRHLAIVSDGLLWVRGLDQLEAVRIERTDGASYPFWSPDSEAIGFFAEGELRRVPRVGGTVQKIAVAQDARGGAWGRDGTIVFAAESGVRGLSRVAATAGEVTAVTLIEQPRSSSAHRYPQFLPDGRILYLYLDGDPDRGGVYVTSLDGAPPARILDGNETALYAPRPNADTGDLLFMRGDALMAQAFDARSLTLSGTPRQVANPVSEAQNTGLGRFSVSRTGVLAHGTFYRRPSALIWRDRTGRTLASLAAGFISNFSADPIGRVAVLLEVPSGRTGSIWVQTAADGRLTRFTFDPSGTGNPVFSVAGDRIAYAPTGALGRQQYDLRWKSLADPSKDFQIFSADKLPFLYGWMPGDQAVVAQIDEETLALPLDLNKQPVPLTLPSQTRYRFPQVSPDGRWLAFSTDLEGRGGVFVQAIPPTEARWQVGAENGSMPRWARDGQTQFYRGADGRLREVDLRVSQAGAAPQVQVLAERTLEVEIPPSDNLRYHAYAVAPDGQRFLVNTPTDAPLAPTAVVLNWQAATGQ